MLYIKIPARDTGSGQKIGANIMCWKAWAGKDQKPGFFVCMYYYYSAKCRLIQRTSDKISTLRPRFGNPSTVVKRWILESDCLQAQPLALTLGKPLARSVLQFLYKIEVIRIAFKKVFCGTTDLTLITLAAQAQDKMKMQVLVQKLRMWRWLRAEQ